MRMRERTHSDTCSVLKKLVADTNSLQIKPTSLISSKACSVHNTLHIICFPFITSLDPDNDPRRWEFLSPSCNGKAECSEGYLVCGRDSKGHGLGHLA